jgi:hypothetical protein
MLLMSWPFVIKQPLEDRLEGGMSEKGREAASEPGTKCM